MQTKEQAHSAAAQNRTDLQREINVHKVEPVDRSIYSKTNKEKTLLWKLKVQWGVRVANGYKTETHRIAG